MRALAIALGAIVLLGCGQSFDRQAAVESFSKANPAASERQAECVVDRLIEGYGLGGLEEQLSAEPAEAAFEEAQFRTMFACGLDVGIRSQILEQLQANDVSEEHAPCVTDAITADLTDDDLDVLLSGEMSDDFFARFVSAMEDCGAINS